ncbi:hypothetical protein [Streptomyces wedmorensis]
MDASWGFLSVVPDNHRFGKTADAAPALPGRGAEQVAAFEALAAHDVAPHMTAADAANKAFRAGPAEVVRLVDAPVA